MPDLIGKSSSYQRNKFTYNLRQPAYLAIGASLFHAGCFSYEYMHSTEWYSLGTFHKMRNLKLFELII